MSIQYILTEEQASEWKQLKAKNELLETRLKEKTKLLDDLNDFLSNLKCPVCELSLSDHEVEFVSGRENDYYLKSPIGERCSYSYCGDFECCDKSIKFNLSKIKIVKQLKKVEEEVKEARELKRRIKILKLED